MVTSARGTERIKEKLKKELAYVIEVITGNVQTHVKPSYDTIERYYKLKYDLVYHNRLSVGQYEAVQYIESCCAAVGTTMDEVESLIENFWRDDNEW